METGDIVVFSVLSRCLEVTVTRDQHRHIQPGHDISQRQSVLIQTQLTDDSSSGSQYQYQPVIKAVVHRLDRPNQQKTLCFDGFALIKCRFVTFITKITVRQRVITSRQTDIYSKQHRGLNSKYSIFRRGKIENFQSSLPFLTL